MVGLEIIVKDERGGGLNFYSLIVQNGELMFFFFFRAATNDNFQLIFTLFFKHICTILSTKCQKIVKHYQSGVWTNTLTTVNKEKHQIFMFEKLRNA